MGKLTAMLRLTSLLVAVLFLAGNCAARQSRQGGETRRTVVDQSPAARSADQAVDMSLPVLILRDGWYIQSAAKVPETGRALSTTEYRPRNWYPATVPATVLAALVGANVYPDPYFGMNLRSIPGTQYPIGQEFSSIQMPPESPFGNPWWYRIEFQLPATYQGNTLWLDFDGINFRANIWLNARRIADAQQVAGPFRVYEFDVTDAAVAGKRNVLAVEVFPPQPQDLQINWVDVNPTPPDKNMGLYRPVRIKATGPVAVRHANVVSHLDLPAMDTARLTVTAELRNATGRAVKGVLKGRIEGITFEQALELRGRQTRKVVFSPNNFPQLTVSQPRVWWPAGLGPQNLYQMTVWFESDGQVSDTQSVQFGIREVTSELTSQGHRLFKINGRRILIRGAGWWSDMLLRTSPVRQEWEIRYALDMNLNTLRMDGKFEDENFLNLCDRYGMMLMPGWCCCDHWERWQDWDEEDHAVAAESLRDRIRSFRTHPSVITWLHADDIPPPPNVEKRYTRILNENDWPNPYQTSSGSKPTQVSGAPGYRHGPYTWVPPPYWSSDRKPGGAFGFNTEASPSAAVPPVESLRKMFPESHLWPIDEFWTYHGGGAVFSGLDVRVFTEALNARFGRATSVGDYALKAQLMAYEAQRAMFEAYGRNKYVSTGVLHEMLNSAWPSLIWSLYDFYLRPAGSYFGTKKACEPLHVQYSYDDRSVVVVNSLYEDFRGKKVTARVYDLALNEKFAKDAVLDVPSDSSTKAFVIPDITDVTSAYFVFLKLVDANGKLVSSNLYWLSTKPDVIDWDRRRWHYTPTKSLGDFTGLKSLPAVSLKVTAKAELGTKGEDTVRVGLGNPTGHLAFFIRLRISKGVGGEEVLPVLWRDNYFSLMPGEMREITATYRHEGLQNAAPVVEVEGWNVAKASQPCQ